MSLSGRSLNHETEHRMGVLIQSPTEILCWAKKLILTGRSCEEVGLDPNSELFQRTRTIEEFLDRLSALPNCFPLNEMVEYFLNE